MKPSAQRGGFFLGMVVGLLIGLALALGVALYVTKVPVPFINKVPQRSADQDAAEVERNKNWDPNSPLAGKNPARPASGASAAAMPATAGPVSAASAPSGAVKLGRATEAASAAKAGNRDPAAILADKPAADPSAQSTKTGADPFTYFVQAGAYARNEDAEQQRARIAMLGLDAKITEREQAGRTMYRVRTGPYVKKEQADAAKEQLDGAGVESALVRVQR